MKQHWRSNSSFINFVRHIRQLLWAPSLYCFVLFLVGDCGKIVIFTIFAKFAAFANFYGPPSLLSVFPRWRLWQNCHFRHICQIRRYRQLLWAPFTALCFASLAIVAKLSFSPYLPNSPFSPTFMGPLYCFVLCLVGDCGKIVIFAIFAKFAAFANFYGPPSLLSVFPRWRLWQNCHFRHICQIRRFRQLLWAPFTALCFASLAIVAKLSFSPYLPNSPLSPTFMGPLHCFLFFLVGDCGKIVIFAIFAKFAAIANFYGPPSLLCVLPRWRLWQNCHFRHICQIRQHYLIFAIFVVVCISGHISEKRGYPVSVVKAGHHRAQQFDRQSSLQTAQKDKNDRIPFTLTFHPHNHAVKSIVLNNFKLLQNDPETGRIFSQPPLISFKRDKNVGNFLVRSALKTNEQPGTFKCARSRCKTCLFIVNTSKISGPKRSVKITDRFTCTSANVIHCITYTLCSKLYIGETGRRLGDRFRQHLRDVEKNDKDASKPVARHFNLPNHSKKHMAICGLSLHLGTTESRKILEQKFIFQIGTLNPHGINGRLSFN